MESSGIGSHKDLYGEAPAALTASQNWKVVDSTKEEMWSEVQYGFNQFQRQRVPPQNHPSDGYYNVPKRPPLLNKIPPGVGNVPKRPPLLDKIPPPVVNVPKRPPLLNKIPPPVVNVPKKPPLLDSRPPLLARPDEGYYSHAAFRACDGVQRFFHGQRRSRKDDHFASWKPNYGDKRGGLRRKSYSRDRSPHYSRDRSSHYSRDRDRSSHYSRDRSSHYSRNRSSRYSRDRSPHYSRDRSSRYSRDQTSRYSRDQSPHKRDAPFIREQPAGWKNSQHSISGSIISGRSYSLEKNKTCFSHKAQNRSKERSKPSLKISRDNSSSRSSAVSSSKMLDKTIRVTEKELAEAESKWANETLEQSNKNQFQVGSMAPLFIDQTEGPKSNTANDIAMYEDSQLSKRNKAIVLKTRQIEQVFRQDCETFAVVVKMLLDKDPSLEKSIQFALKENLNEIGERHVEELKCFITAYDNSQDSGDPLKK